MPYNLTILAVFSLKIISMAKNLNSSQPALSPALSGAVPSAQDGFSHLKPVILPELICVLWLRSLHIWGLI